MKICNLSSLPGEAENVANSAAGPLRYMIRSRHVLIYNGYKMICLILEKWNVFIELQLATKVDDTLY